MLVSYTVYLGTLPLSLILAYSILSLSLVSLDSVHSGLRMLTESYLSIL